MELIHFDFNGSPDLKPRVFLLLFMNSVSLVGDNFTEVSLCQDSTYKSEQKHM